MADSWINCSKCGHRFGAHLPQCPQCQTGNPVYNKSQSKKWGIGKKIGVGIGIFFAVIVGLGLIGSVMIANDNSKQNLNTDSQSQTSINDEATQEPPVSTIPISEDETAKSSSISGIDQFMISGDAENDGNYKLFLSLFNERQQQISSDGRVSLSISDKNDNVLYNKQFTLSRVQFGTYAYQFTGAEIYGYGWNIPKNELKKGMSDYGVAKLVFTDPSGYEFTATDDYVSIPAMTSDEIVQYYEAQYLKSAKSAGVSDVSGDFRVTIERFGNFEHPKYGSYGDIVKVFRIDITLKNLGSSDEYPPDNFVIVDTDSNQHNAGYQSDMPYDEVLAGAVIKGSIIFDDLGTSTPAQLYIKKYGYPEDFVWAFSFS